ncbi:hypothetical protein [Cellulophaga sp. Hel_I_12]|uniref:hypothetical protein n=1 Tax=Cellulophaga sp. Hel_I_12 TaxID=1249972 RepID=UPI000645662F|nr:hypothetical protein [Cellulophaga sp. Hel_I_12]
MIKFFRKIRQQLLTENKFGKYLVYAIGEIILVIIGILIALAINDQSKKRDNNKLLDSYIIQLNAEVDSNLKKLNDNKDETTQILTELDTLIKILVNKEYDNPKLLSKSIFIISNTKFNPLTVTYENLIFSGDLKLFEDLNLRNSISETYASFKDIKISEDIDEKLINIYSQDYLMSNARFINMTQSLDNFGKDAYFENTVIARMTTLSQNRNAYENSIESLKKLKNTFSELQK